MNISKIAIKFYLKHHLVGGKAAIGFESDRFRKVVSMATDSSHRVIMEKTVAPLFRGCFFFIRSFINLQVTTIFMKSRTSYLYVSCSGSITSVGEERANLSAIVKRFTRF